MRRTFILGSSLPSTTWTRTTTPRYWSNHESNTRPRKGPSGCPSGGGSSGRSPRGSRRSHSHLGEPGSLPSVHPLRARSAPWQWFRLRPRQSILLSTGTISEAGVGGRGGRWRESGLRRPGSRPRRAARPGRRRSERRPRRRSRRGRGVDEVENVVLPVLRPVLERTDAVDRDARSQLEIPSSRGTARHLPLAERPVRPAGGREVVLPWSMWR